MNVPDYLHGHVSQLINIETNAAILNEETALRKSRWAVIYNLVPRKDGDKWFVLLGDNLREGIAAFGDTPEEAIINFDAEMSRT